MKIFVFFLILFLLIMPSLHFSTIHLLNLILKIIF